MPYVDFFLGAGSPTGFVGYFSELIRPDKQFVTTLLKSGPGCGKSTFIKKLSQHLEGDAVVERIHCSADDISLDGIICQKKHFAIIDATAPHIVEPKYPGAVENVLSLYHLLNNEELRKNQLELIELFRQNSCFHERATRYITAAGSLVHDSMRVAGYCCDTAKLQNFCNRITAKKLKKYKDQKGSEDIRVLGATTPNGNIFYGQTIKTLADEVVVIEDNYGFVSKTIMTAVRDAAINNGYNIYTCYCAMSPYEKIEHIIIPEISLGFTTKNDYSQFDYGNSEVIKSSRFMRADQLSGRKKRLKFNKNTTKELLFQASQMLKEAKLVHDKIEQHYSAAMDFNRLDEELQRIKSEI